MSGCGGMEAAEHYNTGVELQRKGLLEEAIASYDEAIWLDPEIVNAYYNRGLAYYELGRYERALQDYNESFRIGGYQGFEAYYNRGLAHHGLGQHQRAIEDL